MKVEFHGIWVKSCEIPLQSSSQYWAILGPTYAWRATQISILGERFDLQVGTVGAGRVVLGRFRFSVQMCQILSNQFKNYSNQGNRERQND